MKRGMKFLILLLLVLALSVFAGAEEPAQVISNSQDWRDVYSVMLYGSIQKKTSSFLVSERHSTLLLNSLNKNNHLWVFSSKKNPYVKGYQSLIESRGFSVEEFEVDNINLELAKRSGSKSFIILDDSYGYNAISVAPYAVASKSFVIFADQKDINSVVSFLGTVTVEKIIIYGHVDKEVLSGLKKYSPEIINKDGDRFGNNIEIVKKYQKIKGAKQAVFSNGEFIEREIMSGEEPVIFIGKSSIPDVVTNYVRESDIKVGVLIGNDLVTTATTLRRSLGLSIFVKFAQSARSPNAAISQVEGLDIFYLPVYNLDMSIQSVKFNTALNQLEVTIKNNVKQAGYFKGTYTVTAGTSQTVGDISPVFIEGGTTKTVVYSAGPFSSESVRVKAFVVYGESKLSLEKIIDEIFCDECDKQAQTVSIFDECQVSIDEVSYDSGRKVFALAITNTGQTDCFAQVELQGIVVSGESRDFGTDKPVEISAGETRQVRIPAELDEVDLLDNEIVKAHAFYGQREASLIKTFEGEFELKIVSLADALFNNLSLVFLGIIALLLLGFVFLLMRRKRQD